MSVADQIIAALDEAYDQEWQTDHHKFSAITGAWFELRRKHGVEQFDAAVGELLLAEPSPAVTR